MKSIAELKAIREQMQSRVNMRKEEDEGIRVVVGMATCGIAAGARPVLATFVDEIGRRNLQDVTVSQTGCIGVCRLEPIVEVYEPVSYTHLILHICAIRGMFNGSAGENSFSGWRRKKRYGCLPLFAESPVSGNTG